MNLVYGTYNPSKFQSMTNMLDGLGINLIQLNSLGNKLYEAKENGENPLDNAILKAKTYYDQLKRPIFSCDSGLYFEEVDEKDQPGVFIKRVNGKSMSDIEMQTYYSDLAKKYGGRLTAYYKNAICLIMNEDEIFKYDGEDIHTERFYLVTKPHRIFREGFPLDSLSVDIESMKYYYDLEDEEDENLGIKNGLRNFFIQNLELKDNGI